jgi:type IV pilus assembly protein PilP
MLKRNYIVVLCSAVLLVGCSKDHSHRDLQQYVNDVTKQPRIVTADVPQFSPYNPHIYDAYDKRSPFVPRKQEALVGHPDAHRPLQDLELFSLNSLTMVGTLSDHDSVWALIQTPTGALHKVAVGQYIGKNYGRVVSINQNSVQVKESVFDQTNKNWITREMTLPLRNSGEQKLKG